MMKIWYSMVAIILLKTINANTICDIEVESLKINACSVSFHCKVPLNKNIDANLVGVKHEINVKLNSINEVNTCTQPSNNQRKYFLDATETGKDIVEVKVDLPTNQIIALNFSHNRLISIFHKEFLGFSNLMILDLSHNKITQLDAKSFVTSISNNDTRLEHCRKVQKQVSRCQSEEMSTIKFLDLSFNYIKDLRFLPSKKKTAFFYKNLRVLKLRANKLEKILDHFHLLPDLEVLDLSENNIHHMEPESFITLAKLTWLDISKNKLMNQFSSLTVDTLKQLKYLNAAYCHASDIPVNLYVKILDVTHNDFSSTGSIILDHNLNVDVLLLQNNVINWNDILNIIESRAIKHLVIGSEFQNCDDHDLSLLTRADDYGKEFGVTIEIICEGSERRQITVGKSSNQDFNELVEQHEEDDAIINNIIKDDLRASNSSVIIYLKIYKNNGHTAETQTNQDTSCALNVYVSVILTIILVMILVVIAWKSYGILRIRSLNSPVLLRNKNSESDIRVTVNGMN